MNGSGRLAPAAVLLMLLTVSASPANRVLCDPRTPPHGPDLSLCMQACQDLARICQEQAMRDGEGAEGTCVEAARKCRAECFPLLDIGCPPPRGVADREKTPGR